MNWIDLIIYIIIIATTSLLVIDDVRMRRKVLKQQEQLGQAFIDQLIYLKKISELSEQKETTSIEQTDGFLKFVSQSREMAFEYIENVQDSISSLKLAVENGYPTEEAMEKLFSFLPENNKENNNE